jgi:hypothetical protein
LAGKYTPLENYLRDLPEEQREITLGFAEIERILNETAASAYESRCKKRRQPSMRRGRVLAGKSQPEFHEK